MRFKELKFGIHTVDTLIEAASSSLSRIVALEELLRDLLVNEYREATSKYY